MLTEVNRKTKQSIVGHYIQKMMLFLTLLYTSLIYKVIHNGNIYIILETSISYISIILHEFSFDINISKTSLSNVI